MEQGIQPVSGLVIMEEDSKGSEEESWALLSFGDDCQFSPFAEFVSFGRCSLNILHYGDMYLIPYRVCMDSICENA